MVSIYQIIIPTRGFIPTHRGNLTKMKYIGVTIFDDHYHDYKYVNLITKVDTESTVEANLSFELTLK